MKRRLRRFGIPLLIAVVVGIVVTLLLHHWLNSSSDGTVHVGNTPASSELTPQPLDVKTDYFTTTLPAGFVEKRRTETPHSSLILLQLEANTSSTTDEEFAATVGVLPSAGLSDVGDYNLRVKDPAAYTAFTPEGLPSGATAYQNTSGPSAFTMFWPHGNRYVEVAFSTDGGASMQQLQAVFMQVINAWSWQ